MSRSGDFKRSNKGEIVGGILQDPTAVLEMICLSKHGLPAVQAVSREILAVVELDRTERQHVGRWIKAILAGHGWIPHKKVHVGPGYYFNKGTLYKRQS